jgi:enoyl-CoA hydratase
VADRGVHRRELEPGIHLLTMNRPARLNAISVELLEGLHAEIAAETSCRVVILIGAGRGWCAGLEPAGAPGLDRVAGAHRARADAGAGTDCSPGHGHTRTAAVHRRRQRPCGGRRVGARLGCPDRRGVRAVRRRVRADQALRLRHRRELDAAPSSRAAVEAERMGLVSRVVPDHELRDSALETAQLITGNSPFGVRMTTDVM